MSRCRRVCGDQHVDDGQFSGQHVAAKRRQPVGEQRPGFRLEEWLQFLEQGIRIFEGKRFGVFFDEEIEGIDDRHVGHQVDRHLQLRGLVREHQPRQPVAERILLPVDEMLRRDRERIAVDRRAAMRRRTQSDFVRRQIDRTIEAVGRLVVSATRMVMFRPGPRGAEARRFASTTQSKCSVAERRSMPCGASRLSGRILCVLCASAPLRSGCRSRQPVWIGQFGEQLAHPLPQLWRIMEKYGSPSPMRFCMPIRSESRGYHARSIGRPTEMLLRMVESKEISAHFAAS